MYFALIPWLAVLHIAISASDRESAANGVSDCVSQQELAAVKADMQRQVDELHSQLHYWQNTTINILKEHYFSSDSVGPASECSTEEPDTGLQSGVLGNITAVLHEYSGVLNNITENNKEIQKYLEVLQVTTNERLEELANTVEQSSDKCCNATTGSFHNPAHNCSHIVDIHPNATSGDYWLQSSTGYAVRVYCDMDRVCGCDEGRRGEGGGWMRVADIDMNLQKSCPSGFRKITSSGKVMCGGQSSRCISTSFSSHGVEYSRVCGRIIAYQFGRTNGLRRYHRNQASIESYFLDGIVLTYGSPRSHIWSFVAGHDQYTTAPEGCPCNTGFTGSVPPYIQDDYFCDSGYSIPSTTSTYLLHN